MDKSDPLKPIQLVLKRSENHLYSVEDGGDYFYALSNHSDAKNFKIMRLKGSDFGNINNWESVIDVRDTHYIEDMLTFKEHIVIQTRFDGIPIIGRKGGQIDISQLNLSNIEKIEIVRGPSSVSYGTNSTGGVINLITKRRIDKNQIIFSI